ncbi:MAG TPA: 50S ribosomal protein L7ae-like protein, partial [Bacillota bacterium]|nr:50S ribosomal protein L7ae-like protein [Bacillota bacterium]
MSPAYERVPKRRKAVGARAVTKAICRGSVEKVLVAQDADMKVLRDVLNLARQSEIEIAWVLNM